MRAVRRSVHLIRHHLSVEVNPSWYIDICQGILHYQGEDNGLPPAYIHFQIKSVYCYINIC